MSHAQTEQPPKWKQSVDSVNSGVGMIVGKLYCKAYYPPATQNAMDELIKVCHLIYGSLF
jgi:predicted metalloendopeptidase